MVNATKKLGMTKPMVARLAGTNFKEAAKIIKESGISAVSI